MWSRGQYGVVKGKECRVLRLQVQRRASGGAVRGGVVG